MRIVVETIKKIFTPTPAGATPPPESQVIIIPEDSVVTELPIDIATLLKILQTTSGGGGMVDLPFYRFTNLVVAGGSVTISIANREGYVGVVTSPLELQTDFHSALLNAMVFVDNTRLVTPFGVPLITDAEIAMANYQVLHNNIVLVVTNADIWNANVTLSCQVASIEKTLYTDFCEPLINFSLEQLRAIANKSRV